MQKILSEKKLLFSGDIVFQVLKRLQRFPLYLPIAAVDVFVECLFLNFGNAYVTLVTVYQIAVRLLKQLLVLEVKRKTKKDTQYRALACNFCCLASFNANKKTKIVATYFSQHLCCLAILFVF